MGSTPWRDFIYYFFLLNYFCTIIYIFLNLYTLEMNFPLNFPAVTVIAMPITNCIYIFFIFVRLWLLLNYTANLQNKNMRCPNSMSA